MKGKLTLLVLSLLARTAFAYPEYAVRYNILRCTVCHFSPTGGGPKTINGKLFGAHGYEMNKHLVQDYVGSDFRMLFDYPQKPSKSHGGAGVMSGSVSGHVSLDKAERVQLVLEHNIGGFAQAPYRDTYALFRFGGDVAPQAFDSILVGRFRIPFGLTTDEHRTYTRVQTATEWYAMDTGLMLSGTPWNQMHYDVALVNGERNPGSSLSTGQAERLGGVLNIRYMPGCVLLGASASHYDRSPRQDSRQAASVYGVLSLGRWTHDRVPLTASVEYVRARNWNDHLNSGFASDGAYVAAVRNAESTGWLARLDYALTWHWTLTYKYELLTPDHHYPADLFERHGLGARWMFGPNTSLWLRTEVARATPPSERNQTGSASQNASYAILQLGF